MIYLHELAADSFILVQADWTAGQTRQLIEDAYFKDATHVIVHRVEAFGEYYYLYPREELARRLAHVDAEAPLTPVLNLHESDAVETRDAYADAGTAPARAVIVDEGELVGFYDVEIPPKPGYIRAKSLEANAPAPRSVITEFPEKVRLGDTVSLLVSLSAQMTWGADTLPSMPISTQRDSAVEIVVQARSGFEILEAHRGVIPVVDQQETLPLHFKLKATQPGAGKLRILAFQQGSAQPLGALTLAPEVVERTATIAGEAVNFYQDMAPLSVHQPDLSLLILETTVNGRMELTMRLTTKDQGVQKLPLYGPVRFEKSPEAYFAYFFHDIDTLQSNTPEKRAIAEERLGAKGLELFETLIPKDLQVLLWSLRRQIKTVQILSEEPWIPWELCRLQGEEHGWIVEGEFLCEAFNITRWFVNPNLQQRPTLTLNKIGLVVPESSYLPHAPDERAYLLSLKNRDVQEIPARFLDVRRALASGQYDGWHFTGHGSFRGTTPNRSEMILDQQETLRPEDLNGKIKNLGRAHPLVFLNACEIGQGGMSLTDVGGWSARFIKAGAAAFIGAYWSIIDEQALEFAKAFYTGLLEHRLPIGEAVRQARLAIKKPGEPTRLAYTVFADPLATVQ